MEIDGVNADNQALSSRVGADERRLSAPSGWVKLGPLTQEKGDPFWASLVNDAWDERDLTPIAGFTCVDCPQRERYYYYVTRTEGAEGWYDKTIHNYTQRCRECSRKMRDWSRNQNHAKEAEIASICFEKGISFVTLTSPNMVGCPLASIRKFKRDVAAFRRRFPQDCVAGGRDYYEWTTHPDDRAWSTPIVHNVHMHGIWIMDFWTQASMQEDWGHGIVHLKRIEGTSKAVAYATKYAGKSDVKGIRLKEGFGCLFGRARRAMLDAYAARQELESSTVGDVLDWQDTPEPGNRV